MSSRSSHHVAPASASGATRSCAAAGSAGLTPPTTTSNGPVAVRCSPTYSATSRTCAADGGWPCRASSYSGAAPSQRAARRIGLRFGQKPPIHTGGRGRCTVAGSSVMSSAR